MTTQTPTLAERLDELERRVRDLADAKIRTCVNSDLLLALLAVVRAAFEDVYGDQSDRVTNMHRRRRVEEAVSELATHLAGDNDGQRDNGR